MPILAVASFTRSLQSFGKQGFRDGTHHRHTTDGHLDLETESAQRSKSVKNIKEDDFLFAVSFSNMARDVSSGACSAGFLWALSLSSHT